jgi:hypothetical protein
VRFAARYGFRFERKTLKLLKACIEGGCLKTVSGKRVYAELKLLASEARARKAFGLVRRLGALESIDTALGWSDPKARQLGRLPGSLSVFHDLAKPGFVEDWICWFSVLFLGVGVKRCERLVSYFNLPRGVREVCTSVASEVGGVGSRLARMDSKGAYRVTRLLRTLPPEALVHLHSISGRPGRGLVGKYLKEWMNVRPHLTGGQIVALGVGEGPQVSRLLEKLLKLKLEGRLPTAMDEAEYVKAQLRR